LTEAPTPLDEDARLESLRGLRLLDTEPEERFDRITRMAQRLFDVPIAVFGLVDADRVWFKSQAGLDQPAVARADAFCSHAILTDGIMQVEDAAADPRFMASSLVTGPEKVRFYAGFPVKSAEQRRVGALAIMGTRPRRLAAADLATLADLARGVEVEISAVGLSTVDQLTGLLNLRGFYQFAEKLLKISARSGTPMSLLYADLVAPPGAESPTDGENRLKQLAHLISTTFRQSDVLARIGPRRFSALLPESRAHAGESAAARLRTAVRAWNMEPGIPFRLEVVATGAHFDPQNPVSFETLMVRAEAALGAMRSIQAAGRS